METNSNGLIFEPQGNPRTGWLFHGDYEFLWFMNIYRMIMKQCFPVVELQLLFILNACFSVKHFTNCWKSSKIFIIAKTIKIDPA